MKSGKQVVTFGVHPTPFGRCLIALQSDRVSWISFHDRRESKVRLLRHLQGAFKKALLREQTQKTARIKRKLFDQRKKPHKITVVMKGTPFQIKVWNSLRRIGLGETRSYEQVARSIRKPRAVRAVAHAVASNRIAFLIPCHRVIRKDGTLHEYRWGAKRKRDMLHWESN